MPVVARDTRRVAGFRDLVRKGKVYDDNSPVVKAHPWLFDDTDTAAERQSPPRSTADLGSRAMSRPRVERATAAPGELRDTSHPCPEDDCDVTSNTAAGIAAHHRAKHQ